MPHQRQSTRFRMPLSGNLRGAACLARNVVAEGRQVSQTLQIAIWIAYIKIQRVHPGFDFAAIGCAVDNTQPGFFWDKVRIFIFQQGRRIDIVLGFGRWLAQRC